MFISLRPTSILCLPPFVFIVKHHSKWSPIHQSKERRTPSGFYYHFGPSRRLPSFLLIPVLPGPNTHKFLRPQDRPQMRILPLPTSILENDRLSSLSPFSSALVHSIDLSPPPLLLGPQGAAEWRAQTWHSNRNSDKHVPIWAVWPWGR